MYYESFRKMGTLDTLTLIRLPGGHTLGSHTLTEILKGTQSTTIFSVAAEKSIHRVQLTTSRVCNHARLMSSLLNVMTIFTRTDVGIIGDISLFYNSSPRHAVPSPYS